MKRECICIVVLACLWVAGCAGLKVMTTEEPPQAKSGGMVNGYVSCNGFRPYNGTIVEGGAFGTSNRWGNIVSVDVWPLGGFGASFVGGRFKALPFEVGFGMLGYNPEPEEYPIAEEEESPQEKEEQPDSEEKEGLFLFVDKDCSATS